jgi:nicotinamidase-related amidase
MLFRTMLLIAGTVAGVLPAHAADTITDWANVPPPKPPTVVSVQTDVKTTALLLLDFNSPPCDPVANPRCQAAIPAVKALLARARAQGMFVVYTLGGGTTPDSIDPALQPLPTDPVIPGRPDKFLGTDLDQVLTAHGIKTVITAGTAANGAVLYTASGAAFRGYTVLVPVDGVPGLTPYAEQLTLWQLMNGPRLGGTLVKLTRTDAIGF